MPFPYSDLREYLAEIEAAGELIRIKAEVSSELEITEITDRVSKSLGRENKALLFENVLGYEIPVLINLMGSHQRLEMGLGVGDNSRGYDAIGERIRSLIKPELPFTLKDKIDKLLELSELRHIIPKKVSKGACQEVVILAEDSHSVKGREGQKLLDKLPILKCWPEDGGPFITLTSVFTKDPDKLGAGRNVGMYRLQKFDDITTGMHWHKHHDGASNYSKTLKEGKRMEIAIAIGNDPVIPYCATAPLPPGIDEMLLAGFIRNKPVELVKCKTIDIEVPASSEIVLEGYIDLKEDLVTEGPFGDHTGFYSLADLYPKFHLTALTHRKDPIYVTTIVGIPPQEDCYLGKATERIFLPLLQLVCPEILDMSLPWEGVFHNCALIRIKKKYAGHAFKIMNTIWGTGQLAWTKYVIVFDEDVDIQNYSLAAMHALGNTDPKRDFLFSKGPLDILDHASQIQGFGSKVGIDATRKWKGEGFKREWPDLITMSAETKELVNSKWSQYFTS
jgi:4-hydroxy-3-polyprenylbenzoate decarboxylase